MRERTVVAEISVVPIGTTGASVSEYVAGCVEILNNRGITYRLTPMGTIMQGKLSDILSATAEMHQAPFTKGALRVVTTLKIDDRCDKELSMDGKLKSVRDRIPSVRT